MIVLCRFADTTVEISRFAMDFVFDKGESGDLITIDTWLLG